jgi:hypothetical protein
MNHVFVRHFLAALCTTLLCISSTVIYADEPEPFPEVVRVEQEENPVANLSETLNWATNAIGYDNDSQYLQRIHDDGYYHLVAFSDTGDVVQLHDASKWEVKPSGRTKVLYWVQSDNIFIKPIASCFSFYQYVLHNRTVNQAVEVNLINPPLPMGAYTFRIVKIEPYQRLVLLSDNTVWQVGENANFSYWQVGQRVLVGVNNHWRTAQFPHILINVDQPGQPYSEAIFYGYPLGY